MQASRVQKEAGFLYRTYLQAVRVQIRASFCTEFAPENVLCMFAELERFTKSAAECVDDR